MTRQRKTPADRATARLQQATRIAERLGKARDKAKATLARLDGETEAAEKRRDHYRTDPDLPAAPAPRQPRAPRLSRGAAAAVADAAADGGQPDAATG